MRTLLSCCFAKAVYQFEVAFWYIHEISFSLDNSDCGHNGSELAGETYDVR